MNDTEYKKYHESFMSNNHGSSLSHTFMCIFYTVQCSIKVATKQRYPSELKQYLHEYIFIVLPMILVHTVISNTMEILILIDTCLLIYQLSKIADKRKLRKLFAAKNSFRTGKIQSISCIRGLTYLITIFTIVAVDFKQFPRILAKTERFGYSLMDTGVGLFILMSGLVHRSVSKGNCFTVVMKNLKFVTLLFALGITRVVSVKRFNYHEHITEYGVHWNFYFTLAVCKSLSSIILFLLPHPLMLSFFTLSLHEILLHGGLQDWVFSDTPRISLIAANREGITSCLGYVSMYLFAVHLQWVINYRMVQRLQLLIRLIFTSLLLYCFSYFVNYFKPTSRTLANAGYCFYVEFIFVSIFLIMYVLEVLSQDKEIGFTFEVPLILDTINKNGLVCFLIGNLITGLINFAMQTLLVPAIATFAVLNLYMIYSILFTVYLYKSGLTI